MPIQRQILAITLLAAAAVFAHAGEAAKKEPKTGKNCVTLASTDPMDNRGMVRMNFRNICASPFQIQIQADGKVREGRIEPGSPEKPAKTYINCKPDERCEFAKWEY